MGIYLSIHSVTKIEAQAKRALDSGGWQRYVCITTEDGGRFELSVFGKDKTALIVAFPSGNVSLDSEDSDND